MSTLTKYPWVYLLLNQIGCYAYLFFYYVQENAYGRYNSLQGIDTFLGHQVSATTFFIIFYYVGGAWFLTIIADPAFDAGLRWLRVLLVILAGIIYTCYEIYYWIYPRYMDNPVLDVLLAWLALGILLRVLYIVEFRYRY